MATKPTPKAPAKKAAAPEKETTAVKKVENFMKVQGKAQKMMMKKKC